ncbi:c-type cytochrome [Gelidibacter salicanalis]|uniref:C-type cytochrome n=1 Tax=Gelidibacter salicanalis TaxID=291193 RepID=A0A5C7ADH0_9FLAO|nr:c-type cytochrome [Gelidibacter salicanalis]TXE06726.1 c-type cytochrome [Gelidibacter salicanalis]
MKQVIHRKLAANLLQLGFLILLTFSTSLHAQDGDPAKGKTLYNSNCAACHKLDGPSTGPALRNIEQRLADEQGLDRAWLTAWIHNSAGLIKSGDPYANQIYNEYNKMPMSPFPQLSDQDISDILAYTGEEKAAPPAPVAGAEPNAGSGGDSGTSNTLILGALAVLFALLAMALILVRRTLNRFAEAKGVMVEDQKGVSIWKAFVQNQFLVIVAVIMLLLTSGYFVYGYFMQVGVDQGYAPVQPIHYSHRIHAGDNAIDCKYCHSSARVSKQSGIPSLNVCMNCHKSISEVSPETLAEGQEYGVDYNKEIEKLYAATGWSVADQKYIGEPQPVKWIRIHNLPDFAYFNHSQHVTVGGIECQTCHGPVETMEIMSQHAPLTMGWCINCHRETDVKVEDNAYYTKIHEQLSKKYGVEKLTVAQMGGLECGKCHY